MTRETFTECYINCSKETLVEMLYDTIVKYEKKIEACKNDSSVLNMEQRLIDISLVLEGKLSSKEIK